MDPTVPAPTNYYTGEGDPQASEWEEHISDDGEVYFFNVVTGETSWTNPTAPAQDQGEGDAWKEFPVSEANAEHEETLATMYTEDKVGIQEQLVDQNSAELPELEAETQQPFEENGHGDHDPQQWIEVFDPVTQQQYYYSPRTNDTRWDAPEAATASIADNRKAAAAISIQSLSRGRFARKQVGELRLKKPKNEQQQPMQTLLLDESEDEAMRCREMEQEELLQLADGDQFWGLEIYDGEEELYEQAVSPDHSTTRQNMLASNIRLDEFLARIEEDEKMDTERRQRELQDESVARDTMAYEEEQQCQNGDKFWGIQAEEARQVAANIAMAVEERASRHFAANVREQALNAAWEDEVERTVTRELATRGGVEQRMQARYLRWFYGQCVSVDELLNYRWPSKQQQTRLDEALSPGKKRRQPVTQFTRRSLEPPTPFPLDDLVVRERLEHGDLRYGLRSILTIHHQHPHGTNGTRFEITKVPPECAFGEAAVAALFESMMESPSDEHLQSSHGSDGSYDRSIREPSSVNYRRSETPDPHIPARFNGVPYKPNQISPTRDILSGDHRRFSQLPSLGSSKPIMQAPKLRQLQKAKVNVRPKAKVSTSSPQQPPSRNNAISPRDHVTNELNEQAGKLKPSENGPHDQFVRQEHAVLSQLFALMDVDGSRTVNQDEMRWALQRDQEINALAKTSPLLRLLLKQRSRLQQLFSSENATSDSANRGDNELSLEEFLSRCERCHCQLISDGIIQRDSVATASLSRQNSHNKIVANATAGDRVNKESEQEEAESLKIRRVFALLDNDQNGVLEVAEVRRALYDTTTTPLTGSRTSSTNVVSRELHALVKSSKALQPMLRQEMFMTAFTKFQPLDSRGISEEEFLAFCLEIAQVAAVNNMMANG